MSQKVTTAYPAITREDSSGVILQTTFVLCNIYILHELDKEIGDGSASIQYFWIDNCNYRHYFRNNK